MPKRERNRTNPRVISGRSRKETAGIGFRVRTGNATVVMLGGPAAAPRFLARLYIPLIDMNDDEARQPYHVVAEQDEERGMRLVRQTLETATANAARVIRSLMDQVWILHSPRKAGKPRKALTNVS